MAGSYNIGDTVTLDGIECVVIYKADTEQEWGQYIITDKNHDLSYYIDGSDHFKESLPINSVKYGYEWGGINRDIDGLNESIGSGLSNTDIIIESNIYPSDPDWNLLWDIISQFRSNIKSDKWFLPSKEEIQLIFDSKDYLYNITSNDYYSSGYWTSNTYLTGFAYFFDFYEKSIRSVTKASTRNRSRLCRYTTDSELNPSFNTKTIKISCNTIDAEIRYEYGTYTNPDEVPEPTKESTLYNSPFSVQGTDSVTTYIKAKAFKDGMTPSDSASSVVFSMTSNKLPSPVVTKS